MPVYEDVEHNANEKRAPAKAKRTKIPHRHHMKKPNPFTEEQQQYLAGFAMGSDVARAVRGLPVLCGSGANAQTIAVGGNATTKGCSAPSGPERIAYQAQDHAVAAGGKLCSEEKAKRDKNPLDLWDEIASRSKLGEFPKGNDVFLTKFHGLFYVAPAQDSYMCRLRIPGGELHAHQLAGLASLSDQSAGGYIDITTRANLQLREIAADQVMNILYGLPDLGLQSLGSGGDNIRNVTASPMSGIDPDELIETIPVARRMHHYILNHREMYGLPRKFNIAFDGGGQITALDDTNDIGFHAVRVTDSESSGDVDPGVYFQLTLGGITGHKDFARPTGVIVTPDEALDVAAAIVRVFVKNGNRTDRKIARLKYVLDDWGFDKFTGEVEKELGTTLRRFDSESVAKQTFEDRQAHVDWHPQKQPGLSYVGVVFPVGRMTSQQACGLAQIARRFGGGRIRLTVWQNLLIPDIADSDREAVGDAIEAIGLEYKATSFRAGLVACTGSAGCKFAASNTKRHAMQIAEYLETRFDLDTPINIHLTGCHHSCAQHYIGDIGLLGAKVEVGDDMADGYHIHVGGGWGENQNIARPVAESVVADQCPEMIGRLVQRYVDDRSSNQETFTAFAARHSTEELQQMMTLQETNLI